MKPNLHSFRRGRKKNDKLGRLLNFLRIVLEMYFLLLNRNVYHTIMTIKIVSDFFKIIFFKLNIYFMFLNGIYKYKIVKQNRIYFNVLIPGLYIINANDNDNYIK